MGTTVTYNHVTLHNVVTRDWAQELRYDDSHTDAVSQTFRFRFEGLIHDDPQQARLGVRYNAGAPTVSQYKSVHDLIMETRGELVMEVGNSSEDRQEIFRCVPSPQGGPLHDPADDAFTDRDRDVDNGPKPKAFRVLQVIGAKCLRVSFEIECSKVIISAYHRNNVSSVRPVLNNRWSVSEDMDENHFITRTIAGQVTLSSNVAARQIDAKWLVVPGLEHGFKRTALQFSTDKTGLKCDYRIIDKQVHTAAPWPATKMNARHTQSTNDGLTMSSEVYVELEGPPDASKKLLIMRAMQVIDAKLNFVRIQEYYGTAYFIEHVEVTDHIGERNRVEAVVRFSEKPAKEGTKPLERMLYNLNESIGKPLDDLPVADGEPAPYDPGKSRRPPLYGYSPPVDGHRGGVRKPIVTMLLQCYLQQPFINQHSIADWAGLPEGEEREEREDYPTQVVESPDGELPYSPGDQWSDGAKTFVYTFSTMCSRYTTTQCRVQLPVAMSPGSGQQNTSQVFQLAPAQCQRTIDLDVERAGTWPEIIPPDDTYEDGDLRGMILKYWVEPHSPTLTADGVTLIYRVSAHYLYAMNRPPTIEEKFRIGVSPQIRFKKDDDEVQFNPDVAYGNEELGP